jgi:hypothetical protein
MSLQLDAYMHLRASGASVALACEQSGIGAGEAELWERDIASGEVELPKLTKEECDMPKPKTNDNKVVEVKAPDFSKMKRIFMHDIKPAEEKNAKARGDLSAAWKAIEDDCHCNKRGAKLLHKLYNESEETRDDFLRTLYGGMKALGIGISRDLVDQMSDQDAPTMPVVDSRGLGAENLATIGGQRQEDAATFDAAAA